MAILIGIDIGTSGTKSIAIEAANGRLLASALVEYPLLTPRPGWTEQRPEAWWDAVVVTLGKLVEAGVDPDAVAGIGLSGQMHGSVFLDSAGEVIRPALLWNDQRTSKQCDWINEQAGDLLRTEICNPVLTGFQAGKIVWLRDQEPDNFSRVKHVLLPKDYIRYKLTGEFASEVSDASGTALLNVPARTWSTALLDKIGLPAEWFPTVHESPEITGTLSAAVAGATGLRAGTPVAGGAGDCAAGAVGTGIVKAGLLWVSTGTSGVIFASADDPAVDGAMRTHTFCHAVPGKWHQMGVMLSAGGSLRWYRDALASEERAVAALCGQDPYELICASAGQAPVGSEGLIFLPYLTGERAPYPDPDARGAYIGLGLRHDKRHLARAVLEGVSFGLRDSVEIMKASGVPIDEVRASGGGARSPLWRQIQADVFGLPISTINVDEGPALGVALLAGVGAGLWGTVAEACNDVIRTASTTEPRADVAAVYQEQYDELYRPLYGQLKERYAAAAAWVERHGAA